MTLKRMVVLLLLALLVLVAGYYFYALIFSEGDNRWLYQSFFTSLGCILVLGAVILLLNRLQNRVEDILDELHQQFISINDINTRLGQKNEPADLLKRIENLVSDTKSLSEKVELLISKTSASSIDRKELGAAEEAQPDEAQPEPVSNSEWSSAEPEVSFFQSPNTLEAQALLPLPSSVKDYLDYVSKSDLVTFGVKAETLQDGIFVKSQDGAFMLICEDGKVNDPVFVVPKIARFTSTQDYDHYRRYYECADPCAGEVWILKPAIAAEVHAGEWQLTNKGQLRVES